MKDTVVRSIENTDLNYFNVPHYNVKIVKKKQNIFKYIASILSYAIFIWLLLIGLTLLIYVADIKIRASRGDLTPPKFNAYVVLTGSMLPDIQINDVVLTKKIEGKDYKVGDVITFISTDPRFSGTVITHRIIEINQSDEYLFRTKGDNNNVADDTLVNEKNILGKVILKIPKLGYVQYFLASQGGWIVAILIPCLAVISYDIYKLMKKVGKKIKKK